MAIKLQLANVSALHSSRNEVHCKTPHKASWNSQAEENLGTFSQNVNMKLGNSQKVEVSYSLKMSLGYQTSVEIHQREMSWCLDVQ